MSTESAAEAKPRVLVVDDSRVIRVAARKILKEEFEALEAGDGEEAWELLTKEPDIALVLSDLSMPYLDGMGLLQRLRNADDERLRSLPMIIVTGAEDDDEAKTRAFAAGATDFISKPFDSVQLLAHTRSHLRLQQTTQELKETTTVLHETPATDPFTGLGNQRAFLERGQQALAHAVRHRSAMALLLFQVDGFDKIFVQQGKPVGGAILKAVTAALQAEIRREDAAARISMARFGLITCCADAAGARRLASRIGRRIATSSVNDKNGAPLALSISASLVALGAGETPRFEELLTLLAKRLERAMAQGGCAVVDDSADVLRFDIESEMEPETPAVSSHAVLPEAVVSAPVPAANAPDSVAPRPDVPDATIASEPTPPTAPASNTAEADAPVPVVAAMMDAPAAEADPGQSTCLSVDEALALLAHGEVQPLAGQWEQLIRKVLPLLTHWNQNGSQGLDDALEQIRTRLPGD
ncbi:MAG: response regulator [Thiohalobacteraceae bacterium]